MSVRRAERRRKPILPNHRLVQMAAGMVPRGQNGSEHQIFPQSKIIEFSAATVQPCRWRTREQKKIVNLHTKGAEEEVLELLDQYNISRVMVHWYSGPLDTFRELVARGVYFTVGIEVLYSKHIQTITAEIPSGRLLTETDNPGGPKGFIGRTGTPALVKEVVRGIAEVKKITVEVIVQAVQANLAELIRDDPWLADTYSKVLEKQPNGG